MKKITNEQKLLSFEQLSIVAILIVAFKELYKRHAKYIWLSLSVIELIYIIWTKIS